MRVWPWVVLFAWIVVGAIWATYWAERGSNDFTFRYNSIHHPTSLVCPEGRDCLVPDTPDRPSAGDW
jgi:hypothetical protein